MLKWILNVLLATKMLKKFMHMHIPLCIFLPKMNAYRRGFDRTKCMPFLVIEEKLFEKYNEIWKKSQQHCQKRISQ